MANVEWSARAMRSSSLPARGTRSWLQSRYAFSVAARRLMRTRIRIWNNRQRDRFGDSSEKDKANNCKKGGLAPLFFKQSRKGIAEIEVESS